MDQIFLGNRYELQEEIGSGGMAHVFKARDTLLDRIVAIKILKPEYTEDAQFIERFRVEAKAAASLSNASIVMIYDVGQDDGIYYIIMEYVDGITLKEYIANAGRLAWKESVTLAVQMTQAIDSAHSNHIIHRDIKPQNVLMTRDRKIKITDFGIARAASSTTITTVGNAMGSVHYFSPEQAKGELTDEKSDIYSMGITLYEMLTGTVPFDGETPIAVALKHIQEPAAAPSQINPQVPPGLDAIVLKAIAKNKYDRYQSMGEMLADLKKVMKDPSGKTLQFASIYIANNDWSDAKPGNDWNDGKPGGDWGDAKPGGDWGDGKPGGDWGDGYDGDPYNRDGRYGGPQPVYGAGNGNSRQSAYQREGNYRDVRYEEVPYSSNGYENARAQYGQTPYYDRDGYPRNDYNGDGGYDDADRNYGEGDYDDEYEEDMTDRRAGQARQTDLVRRAAGKQQNRRGVNGGGSGGGGNRGKGGAGAGRLNGSGGNGASPLGGSRRSGANMGRRASDRNGGRNGVFIAIVLVAVLAAIGFVIWIMNYLFNMIPPQEAERGNEDDFPVGNYVGRVYEEVKAELKDAGINSDENRVPNDVISEGLIVGQNIERGRIIRRNGPDIIVFEVSGGARRFAVPDYREYDTDSRAAEAELRANSLNVTIIDESSGAVRKGNVIRTDPGAGTQLSAGAKITLYRSLGADVNQSVVPRLIGKTYREALALIEDAGLRLGAISPDDIFSTALVIRQSISPDSLVDEGVSIDLWFEGAEPSPSESETETTTEQEPEETPAPTPTPTPEATAEPSDPEASPTPGADAATTTEEQQTTKQTETTASQTGIISTGEPVSMTIRLKLPANNTYSENIKVLVEATPSDTGRTTRLLNRTVKKDDFPKNVDFTIPADGSIEIKVYYDGVLMVTQVYKANE